MLSVVAKRSTLLRQNVNCIRQSSSASKPIVGFIGLGNMGAFMASNLARGGHPLVVHDLDHQVVEKVKERARGHGGIVDYAKTPKELAAKADYIVTMLPSSPHVLSVYTSENGILSAVKKNALLMDTSTIDPTVARDLAKTVHQSGAAMVDAPVSGGVGGAEAGTLTFMVGGSVENFQRAETLLKLMGKNIVHCGEAGSGQVVKVCNNLALAIEMIGVAEAMNLGVSFGMDPKILAGIFNTSSARCWSSDTYNPVPGVMPNVPASRGYTGGFGVDLMAKDLGLASSAANAVRAPIPLGSQALQLYNMISAHGGGKKDFSFVYDFLKKQSEK
ncbi:3-hydroxyisobutyrate dehydrogenase [Planoprotostelium fungivorum]|uniref:3-hydroxyisobutyrate dehydrogenase n=1 Tax=Planoprotostelium fungivorum TaxID=1890364 RepID=A0A2P6NG09_9EUKA|nr:3-hydroxyisobutyrate dehydrogenase [Planoprotostelium fungivorum]